MLLEGGLNVAAKTMVLTLNVSELEGMQKMADDWGIKFRYDPAIFSRLDGNRQPISYRLEPKEIIALERRDDKRSREWRAELCAYTAAQVHSDSNRLFRCGAGTRTFHVNAYGKMHPCMGGRHWAYDLACMSIAEALDAFTSSVRSLYLPADSPCRECDLLWVCRNCPGGLSGNRISIVCGGFQCRLRIYDI